MPKRSLNSSIRAISGIISIDRSVFDSSLRAGWSIRTFAMVEMSMVQVQPCPAMSSQKADPLNCCRVTS